jgi:hypothetical protein
VSVLVNLPSLTGLAVLLVLTWLLRGARAVLRWCAWISAAQAISGLAAGSILVTRGGAVITGTACWALRSLRRSREPGRRRTRDA